MNKPHARVRIDFSESCSLGPGKIALLEGIERTGSLSAAARALGMSYRRGWLLLHSVNNAFAEPAVALTAGGKDGGGARLTEFGRRLIATYRDLESAVDALTAKAFASLHAKRTVSSADTAPRRSVSRSLIGAHSKRRK
ncbi:MAG: LysR family transcriptional regulator [Steroidobacteraceae bacterium]|nr:LysR family transcriptional regulator [Steroidobacteraceae bacterium]